MSVNSPALLSSSLLAPSLNTPVVLGATTGLVTLTLPSMSVELSEESMRDMGRLGSHIAGHYVRIGTMHYLWWNHDGLGWDPGAASLEGRSGGPLEGLTGIEVTLASGNRTAAQVATATATAIDGTAGLSATADDDQVSVTGAATATAGARTFATASGQGLLGMRQTGTLTYSPFNSDTIRAARLDPSALPAGPFVVSGFRVRVEGAHSVQLAAAIYQGGTASSFEGATLVGSLGVTSGSATSALLYTAATPLTVDPSAGQLWVAWMHDSGSGFTSSYADITSADGLDSQYIATGANGTYLVTSGVASSDPADLPASLGVPTGGSVVFPSIALAIVPGATGQCDMRVSGRLGTRADSNDLNQQPAFGPSEATLFVGNSYTSPDVLGMTLDWLEVAYGDHDAGSHYRGSFGTGGTAANNHYGSTDYDVGQFSAAGTGWVRQEPPSPIAIPAATRCWMKLRFDGSGSSLLYQDDLQAPDGFNDSGRDPAAYFNGFTTESEFDDGTLSGTASTNISFDPAIALTGLVQPNGTNYNFDNGVGVRGQWSVPGFAVS